MSEELKPCPFCGGTDLVVTEAMGESWVLCKNEKCLATCSGNAANKATAIVSWNTRVESDELPEWVVKKIQSMIDCGGPFYNDVQKGYELALNQVLSLRRGEE